MGERFELRIKAPHDHLKAALELAEREAADFAKYDKIGWGWAFAGPPRFFVRRIRRGLSVGYVGTSPSSTG